MSPNGNRLDLGKTCVLVMVSQGECYASSRPLLRSTVDSRDDQGTDYILCSQRALEQSNRVGAKSRRDTEGVENKQSLLPLLPFVWDWRYSRWQASR
jgi:hypothetical protein